MKPWYLSPVNQQFDVEKRPFASHFPNETRVSSSFLHLFGAVDPVTPPAARYLGSFELGLFFGFCHSLLSFLEPWKSDIGPRDGLVYPIKIALFIHV